MKINRLITTSALALPLMMSVSNGAMALSATEEDYELKLLGKYLFFDQISEPARQACATCHTPDAGWTNGTSGINLKQVAVTGANPHTAGNLKPPSNAYASFAKDLEVPCTSRLAIPSNVCGGNFWNGRAKGDSALITGATGIAANGVQSVRELQDSGQPILVGTEQLAWTKYFGPTADQANASPFINPVEQGFPDKTAACEHVKKQKYAQLFEIVWGGSLNCTAGVSPALGPVDVTFARFAVALAAYQTSRDVNAFASKRDQALATDADQAFPLDGFTAQENLGHDLFYNTFNFFTQAAPKPELPITNCAFCHNSSGFPIPQANIPGFGNNTPVNKLGTDPQELYTDMTYHNIGTPRNHEIPGNPEPDSNNVIQLEAITGNDAHRGAVKTPTLRNVDKRRGSGFKKAYGHNGWFKSLESIVHFYNTGDTANSGVAACPPEIVTEKDALANNCWPAPENTGLLAFGALIGNMGMTADQEAALVAYLKTLTDIPTPKAPAPFDMKKFEAGQLN